jgi:restriction system protein
MPAIPDYQTLMLPVLRLAANGEITIPRAVEALAQEFSLTPSQLAERIPSGRSALLNSRAHWAKTYLLQAGLLEQPRRGWFKVSSRGRQVLAQNPKRIDKEFLLQFPEFKEFLQRSSGSERLRQPRDRAPTLEELNLDEPASALPPDERIDHAAAEIEAALRDELLDRIFAIEPVTLRAAFFEQLVIQLLVAMGYGGGTKGTGLRLGASGDGGVDGVIQLDTLGMDRVYIQAKCYARERTIGAGDVRDFSGALDHVRTTRGVFITTAQFTQDAQRYVESIQCMSSEHFGQLAWQFKRVSGSSGLKVQAAIAC